MGINRFARGKDVKEAIRIKEILTYTAPEKQIAQWLNPSSAENDIDISTIFSSEEGIIRRKSGTVAKGPFV